MNNGWDERDVCMYYVTIIKIASLSINSREIDV